MILLIDFQNQDDLILSQMGLVRTIARNMVKRLPPNIDLDDLVGMGTQGLVEAARRFDASRGLSPTTFFTPRIRGAIIDGLRSDELWSRRKGDVEVAQTELRHKLKREPLREEVAALLGMMPRAVDMPFYWDDCLVRPLEDCISEEAEAAGMYPRALMVSPADTSDPLESITRKRLMREALAVLPPRERRVVELHYLEGLTFREIGRMLCVSESRVSQLHQRALRLMRRHFEA